jgi:hypothetical protein
MAEQPIDQLNLLRQANGLKIEAFHHADSSRLTDLGKSVWVVQNLRHSLH